MFRKCWEWVREELINLWWCSGFQRDLYHWSSKDKWGLLIGQPYITTAYCTYATYPQIQEQYTEAGKLSKGIPSDWSISFGCNWQYVGK